ncbi:MAG: hypothetical protein R3F11_24750 [Verrucomicrobiales bacterium]
MEFHPPQVAVEKVGFDQEKLVPLGDEGDVVFELVDHGLPVLPNRQPVPRIVQQRARESTARRTPDHGGKAEDGGHWVGY